MPSGTQKFITAFTTGRQGVEWIDMAKNRDSWPDQSSPRPINNFCKIFFNIILTYTFCFSDFSVCFRFFKSCINFSLPYTCCIPHQSHSSAPNTARPQRKAFRKEMYCRSVFLNRRAATRYRALASIIPARERFFWNLSF